MLWAGEETGADLEEGIAGTGRGRILTRTGGNRTRRGNRADA